MSELTISLAQIKVVRADPAANLEKGEVYVKEAAGRGSEIICFPEMWTTGFDWAANRHIAGLQDETIKRIARLAGHYHIWINGSILAGDDKGRPSNTSMLFGPDGEIKGVYRKMHLFSYMHEEKHMAAGDSLSVVNTPWGKAGLSICYDLRFPELFRLYALKGVKIQFLPSAFPHPRLEHWKILLRARAIENQMFVIGVNQVGNEALHAKNPVTYFGNSAIIGPWGETVIEGGEEEMLLTATIDIDLVDRVRMEMQVLKDRRPELYKLD